MAGESFVDNPFVQAIGAHLGMSPLMGGAGAGDPSKAPAPPVPVPKPGRSNTQTPREFRQHAPEPHQRGSGLGGNSGPQPGMNLPGMMSRDVLMNPEVQKLLNRDGVSPQVAQSAAQNADPNLFVTNPEAFQKHPVMAGLLERGLEGAAFGKTSNTWGEGMSNIAQSVLSAQAARADKFNNQLMLPFGEAQQVANLKGTQLEQFYKAAAAQRDLALQKHYADMDDWHQAANDIQRQRVTDLGSIHKGMNDIILQRELDKIPFNDQENAQLSQLSQAAQGHLSDIPPDQLNALISTAHQRLIDATEKGKTDRAKIGTHRSSESFSHSDHLDPAQERAIQDQFDKATKDHQDFQTKLASQFSAPAPVDFTGADGKPYPAGTLIIANSALAGAAIKASQKRRDDAQDQLNRLVAPNPMQVPGSGMTRKSSTTTTRKSTTTHVPTLNLSTGRIE